MVAFRLLGLRLWRRVRAPGLPTGRRGIAAHLFPCSRIRLQRPASGGPAVCDGCSIQRETRQRASLLWLAGLLYHGRNCMKGGAASPGDLARIAARERPRGSGRDEPGPGYPKMLGLGPRCRRGSTRACFTWPQDVGAGPARAGLAGRRYSGWGIGLHIGYYRKSEKDRSRKQVTDCRLLTLQSECWH